MWLLNNKRAEEIRPMSGCDGNRTHNTAITR